MILDGGLGARLEDHLHVGGPVHGTQHALIWNDREKVKDVLLGIACRFKCETEREIDTKSKNKVQYQTLFILIQISFLLFIIIVYLYWSMYLIIDNLHGVTLGVCLPHDVVG